MTSDPTLITRLDILNDQLLSTERCSCESGYRSSLAAKSKDMVCRSILLGL